MADRRPEGRAVKKTRVHKLPKLQVDDSQVHGALESGRTTIGSYGGARRNGSSDPPIVCGPVTRGRKRNEHKSSSFDVAAAVACMEKALPCLREEVKAPKLGVDELARAKEVVKAVVHEVETLAEMARGKEKTDLMREMADCSATKRTRLEVELALVKRQKAELLEEEVARLKKDAKRSAARHRQETSRLMKEVEEVTHLWKEEERSAARQREEKEDLLARHEEAQQALQQQLEEEREKSLCISCMEKARDTLVLPCLHFHYCFACLLQHRTSNSNTCPTCRRGIDGLCMSSSLANQ